jgi:threonine aldolase
MAPALAAMKKRGVLAGTAADDQIRFVTHNDVDRAACERAAKIAAEVIAGDC